MFVDSIREDQLYGFDVWNSYLGIFGIVYLYKWICQYIFKLSKFYGEYVYSNCFYKCYSIKT